MPGPWSRAVDLRGVAGARPEDAFFVMHRQPNISEPASSTNVSAATGNLTVILFRAACPVFFEVFVVFVVQWVDCE
jgi:hypothetical protein